jgi:hypothetical protein
MSRSTQRVLSTGAHWYRNIHDVCTPAPMPRYTSVSLSPFNSFCPLSLSQPASTYYTSDYQRLGAHSCTRILQPVLSSPRGICIFDRQVLQHTQGAWRWNICAGEMVDAVMERTQRTNSQSCYAIYGFASGHQQP